jgi:HKD family nuclease
VRYIQFVEKILNLKEIPSKLVAYRLSSISQEGLHDKHYVSIRHVRTGELLVDKFNFSFHSKIGGMPLLGDLFI